MNASDLYADFAARTPTKTIWVSPRGSNANNGDAGSPLKTIQAAVDRAEAGTAIMVKAGTYKGSLDLGGLHGTPEKPIKLISADGQGAAKIVGGTGKAAIQAYKISNVGIYDFEVVANTSSGDIGGMKIWGPWNSPARNLVISGNTVTGKGTDGIKLFNGAKDVLVIGNTIKGNWRQEAIDNVSVEDTVFAYNTIKGTAGNTGITMKAGSRNIELFGNDIDLAASVGIYVGGHGNSRLHRSFPDYWKGFEAKNIHVHDNVIGERITGKSLVFVGSNNNTVERNSFADNVGSVDHKVAGHFTYHSFNNKLINNSVDSAGFFKPDSGESKGYVVSGNTVGGSKPSAGVDSPELASFLASQSAVDSDPPPSNDEDQDTAPDAEPPMQAPDGVWAESAAFTRTINGTSASQTLTGTTGHDKMVGHGGEDRLVGGEGDDLYIVDSAGDLAVEVAGQGTDTVYLWMREHALAAEVENLVVKTGVGATATGNVLDNIIQGGAGADTIDGGAGRDLLSGGAGADTFVIRRGQAGDEIVDLAAADMVRLDGFALSSFADVQARMSQKSGGTSIDLGGGETLMLRGVQASTLKAGQFEFVNSTPPSPAPDGAWAESAAFTRTINGTSASQTLTGTTGHDKMVGHGGEDRLVGGEGDDLYIVDSADDQAVEVAGQGTDTVYLWMREHALDAEVENLVVKTGVGATATGNVLDNIIQGGAGADTIDGGAGRDLLSGGAGADTFVIRHGQAGDEIVDLAATDMVRLDGFALSSFADVQARMSQKSGGTLIDLGGGETLMLRDVQASTLKAGQFEFANSTAPSPAFVFRDASSWQLTSETARKNIGTTGDDTMTGTKGDEIYVIGQTGDRIAEQSGHGTDTAYLWIRDFTLSDHVENLIVRPSKDTTVTGNDLDNVIVGGTGANVTKGLGGADLLTGGAGRDTFVYTDLADAGDVITDFERGTDTLDLRPLTQGLTGESIFFSKLEDGLAVVVEQNGTEHGLALLQGVSDSQLTIGTDILI